MALQQKEIKSVLTGEGSKISNTMAEIMVVVALLFDFVVAILNLIPVAGGFIGSAVNIFGYMIFIFWFLIKGVKLMTGKRVASMGIGFLIEMIPVVNALPGLTASVVLTIASTRVKLPKAIPIENNPASNRMRLLKAIPIEKSVENNQSERGIKRAA